MENFDKIVIEFKNNKELILIIILSYYTIILIVATFFIYEFIKEKQNIKRNKNPLNRKKSDNTKIGTQEPLLHPLGEIVDKKEPENELSSREDPSVLELINKENNIPEERSQIFYLPAPSNREGSFLNDLRSESMNKAESFYVLTLENNKEASFHLIDDPEIIKKAVSASAYIIEPVCESENEYFSTATSVIIGEPGRCQLIGDEWMLMKKARIKYI